VTTSTINEALERFVEAGSEPGAGPRREGVVELFRSYLDNYACETLDQADRSRWERAVEVDEDAGSSATRSVPSASSRVGTRSSAGS
jgi:hypothetical protein